MDPAFDLTNYTAHTPRTVLADGSSAVEEAIAFAKTTAKKLAKKTGLDQVPPEVYRELLWFAAGIAVNVVCRRYFFPAAPTPPPTTTEVVLGWIKTNAHPTVSHFCHKVAPWVPALATFGGGALATHGLGVLAGALVPSAMSYFGVVVPGAGTMHPKGGVAATLQRYSIMIPLPFHLIAVGIFVAVFVAALSPKTT